MSVVDNPDSTNPQVSFNTGDVTVKEEKEVQQRSPKEKEYMANVPPTGTQTTGTKEKGIQYLVLSVVGYVCASIVFGFLLNKKGKESNV